MAHTIRVDKGDHFNVIADYSGFPKVARMTDAEWQNYYATHPSFAAMRASQGGVAGVTTRGIGVWKKDFSGPHVEAHTAFKITSSGSADFDGVPAVAGDGVEKHTVTVQKVNERGGNVNTGSDPIRVLMGGRGLGDGKLSLTNGSTTFEVGPITGTLDVDVRVQDPSNVIRGKSLKVRFK